MNPCPKGDFVARFEQYLCLIHEDDSAFGLSRLDPVPRDGDVRVWVGGIDPNGPLVRRECASPLPGDIGFEANDDEAR